MKTRTPFFPGSKLVYKLLLLIIFIPVLTWAQTDQNETPDTAEVNKILDKISALENILTSIPDMESELEIKRNNLLTLNLTDEQKTHLSDSIEQLDIQLKELENNFGIIASGIDESNFFEVAVKDPEVNINKELREIFYPAVKEFRKVTTRPMEIEALRSQLSKHEEQVIQIEEAIDKLTLLKNYSDDELLSDHLDTEIKKLKDHDDEIKNKAEAVSLALEEKLDQTSGFFSMVGNVFKSFFVVHGKNLLFSLLVLFGSLFLFRTLHTLIRRIIKPARSKNWHLALRLFDLTYFVITISASFMFFVMVLYSGADWLLLGISIFLFIGVLWVGKNFIPLILGQIKLLLDLGPVREGERVIYNNLPWEIESLNFYSTLRNDEMDVATIVLPLKDLLEMRSRPSHENEHWFPSSTGDWLMMSDGTYGQVINQSPELIVLEVDRGSIKTYTLESYLQSNPQNFSRNNFSVIEVIGIDYKYRHRISSICSELKELLDKDIVSHQYNNWIVETRIELAAMNSSSLDLRYFVKFKGDAAAEYPDLKPFVQQAALDGLNKLNLDIPYPHLTIIKN